MVEWICLIDLFQNHNTTFEEDKSLHKCFDFIKSFINEQFLQNETITSQASQSKKQHENVIRKWKTEMKTKQ